MHILWGILTATAGLLMFYCGSTRSEFWIYRVMAERSRSVWGGNTHRFYQLSGIAVIVVGVLVALKVIGR